MLIMIPIATYGIRVPVNPLFIEDTMMGDRPGRMFFIPGQLALPPSRGHDISHPNFVSLYPDIFGLETEYWVLIGLLYCLYFVA